MYMVVDMLASNDWCNRVGFSCTRLSTSILKLHAFLLETSLDGFWITVLMLTVFNRDNFVVVLLGQHFSIFDRLNRSVVMILVDLTVNGSGGLLMTVLLDFLVHDSGSNLFVHSGVMVTSFVPKEWDDKREAPK